MRSAIYTRFGKSRCLITNRSGDISRLTSGDLVGEKFKGTSIIKLYQAFVRSNNKSITFSVEEILVKEMERRKSFLDEYEE